MMDLQNPTVWQLMAAFASDEYEFREVAPGEYEIVPADRAQSDEEAARDVARQHERVSVADETGAYAG